TARGAGQTAGRNRMRTGPGQPARPRYGGRSGASHEGITQVLINRLLRDAERTADPDCLELTRVHEPVNGHLRHAHDGGHLSHSQEPDIAERGGGCFNCHVGTSSGGPACGQAGFGAPVTSVSRVSPVRKRATPAGELIYAGSVL